MKKTIKFMALILGLSLISLPVFADDDEKENEIILQTQVENEEAEIDADEKNEVVVKNETNKNAVGIYIMGWSSDQEIGGLQYQHWFDSKVGLQLTLGGLCHPGYDNSYLDSYLSGGLHLQFNPVSTNLAKVFYSRFYIWAMGGVIARSNYDISFQVNACAGFGIGAELVWWHRMSMPIEFGFAGDFPNNPVLSFSGAIGLRYRF